MRENMPSSCVIQWINEAERGGTGRAARRQIPGEVPPELRVLIHAVQEYGFVHVLQSWKSFLETVSPSALSPTLF